MVTESVIQPLSWLRSALIAIGLGSLLLLAPQLVNHVVFGDPAPKPIDFVIMPVWVTLEAATLTFALRWGQRRRASTFITVTIAYVLAALCGAALNELYELVARAVGFEANPRGLVDAMSAGLLNGMLVVGVWALFFITPRAVADARDRDREHQEQRRDIERARVRAAIEPHFVLNTLNAIGGLIGEDPERARDLIGDLGDLLRDAVRLSEHDTHTAAAEVAWLERYTRILEARHQGRLTFTWQVDPAAAALTLPVLLLQPLVENAIHHGALQRPGGGSVRVAIELAEGGLRCTVSDDGPGIEPGAPRAGAHGLDLTRRRLASAAPGGTFALASTAGGTRAVICLPEPRA